MRGKHKSRGSITAEACYTVWAILMLCLLFVWICGAQMCNARVQSGINTAATTIGGAGVFEGADAQSAATFLQFSGCVTGENVTVTIDSTVVQQVLTLSEREAVTRLMSNAQERWYCTAALFDETLSPDRQQALLAIVAEAELFSQYGDTLSQAETALGKKLEELDFSASVIADGAVWLTVRHPLFANPLAGKWNPTIEERSVATIWR